MGWNEAALWPGSGPQQPLTGGPGNTPSSPQYPKPSAALLPAGVQLQDAQGQGSRAVSQALFEGRDLALHGRVGSCPHRAEYEVGSSSALLWTQRSGPPPWVRIYTMASTHLSKGLSHGELGRVPAESPFPLLPSKPHLCSPCPGGPPPLCCSAVVRKEIPWATHPIAK